MDEYLTGRYRTSDSRRVLFMVERFPLATMIADGVPGAPPVFAPVVPEHTSDGGALTLIGHLDNSNPLLEHLDGRRVRAIFHGPNAYISPLDYVSRQFPTWNYAVAHLTGRSTLVADEPAKAQCMTRMVEALERRNGTDYRLDPADAQVAAMLRRITFFRLTVESMDGVFKFAQEKDPADRSNARRALARKVAASNDDALPYLAADLVPSP